MRLIHWLLLAGLLAAHGAAAQSESNFSIRIYQVPAEHQEAIETVLGQAVSLALGMGQRNSPGVSSPGQGQIVVTAPPHIHADIERFLQDFQPAEISNLRTEYWIIRGRPGAEGPLPSELEPVSEVLASIGTASGTMSYSLEDRVEILSRAGGTGAIASIGNGSLSQQFDYIGGKIVGEFSLQYQTAVGNNFISRPLETEIAVNPGQYVVLGRIGLGWGTGLEDGSGDSSAPSSLFIILRSRLAD